MRRSSAKIPIGPRTFRRGLSGKIRQITAKFSKTSQHLAKFGENLANLPNSAKKRANFPANSAWCRSRRDLSNAYFVANIRFDAAESEPCKLSPLSAYRSPRFKIYGAILSLGADGVDLPVCKLHRVDLSAFLLFYVNSFEVDSILWAFSLS